MMDPTSSDAPARTVTLTDAPIRALDDALAMLEPALVSTLRDLIRTESQNLPPVGYEFNCQQRVASSLREIGLEPDIYEISSVASLASHPEFWPGRDYSNRPNVNAIRKGSGGGRSLILSGHIDTVPIDTPVPWTRSPLGDDLIGERLYGRGAWDMKAGIAMNITVLRALHLAKIQLRGDLIFESVVDEEFGGVNGTLAGRLRGYNGDAAVIGEPTSLRICPAQRGGRTVHITLHGPGGILGDQTPRYRVMDQLNHLLSRLEVFQKQRESRVTVDPYFADCTEPFAVWVTNVATGKWGWTQPITVPERCQVELYWQAMPSETQAEVEAEFHEWLAQTVAARQDLFPAPPDVRFPMRWLPGCSIMRDTALVSEFSATAGACGTQPLIEGLDAPSDMYIFQNCFDTPAIMWGPDGAGAHQADEYVDIPSLIRATRILAQFACRWCGTESAA